MHLSSDLEVTNSTIIQPSKRRDNKAHCHTTHFMRRPHNGTDPKLSFQKHLPRHFNRKPKRPSSLDLKTEMSQKATRPLYSRLAEYRDTTSGELVDEACFSPAHSGTSTKQVAPQKFTWMKVYTTSHAANTIVCRYLKPSFDIDQT